MNTDDFQAPTWHSVLIDGVAPDFVDPLDDGLEPCERGGWQREASEKIECNAKGLLFARSTPATQARLRSSSGLNASKWLITCPTEKSLTLTNTQFRYACLRRIGLSGSAIVDACEGCGRELDFYGNHRATCMRSGRVQRRQKPLIRIWRQIFAEAGMFIPERNIERVLSSTAINRGHNDSRRMDIISAGIPHVFNGCPLFIDVTMVHPLTGRGIPHHRSDSIDGIKRSNC